MLTSSSILSNNVHSHTHPTCLATCVKCIIQTHNAQKLCGFLFTCYTFLTRWFGYIRMRALQERNSFQLHSGAAVLWPTSKVNLGSFVLFTIYNKTSLLTPHSFKCWGNINKITSMYSVN